jgi:hypothetical protein
MIRIGWFIVLAAGMLVALVRVAGAASVADVMAMAYLILATLTFGRPRISPAPDRVLVRRRIVLPYRRR